MMRHISVVAATVLVAVAGHTQTVVSESSPGDSSAIFSGVYTSTFSESIFSPCDVPGIGSGWSLRFRNARDGRFLRARYGAGSSTLIHFIRVRGRVSGAGHYGLGFQTREIVVDSVLGIEERLRPCVSYEDVLQPWETIKSSGAPIIGAAVRDDKSLVALLDREGFINVWSTSSGELIKRFPSEDEGSLKGVARVEMEFDRDGKRLAMGGVDGVIRVWNPLTATRISAFAAIDSAPGTVAGRRMVARSGGLTFNRSGTLLASMNFGRVAIWSTVTGKRVGTFDGREARRFLFIGDSSFIASADSGVMNIYPRLGAEPIWRIRSAVRQVDVMERSPDGRWLVVKSAGDTAYVWSLRDGQPGAMVVMPHGYMPDALAFSPDGKTIATAGGGSALYVWDMKTGQPLRSFRNYRGPVFKAWFTADGRSLVSWEMGDTILRIAHLEPNATSPVQTNPGSVVWSARWHPGGSLGSISGFVRDSARRAIVGADVWIFDGDRPGSAPIGKTSTNAAGRFLLQQIKVPHVIVRAAKQGFTPQEQYVHLPDDEADASIDLKADRSSGGAHDGSVKSK
jgi:WD40 repeat protein